MTALGTSLCRHGNCLPAKCKEIDKVFRYLELSLLFSSEVILLFFQVFHIALKHNGLKFCMTGSVMFDTKM